MADKYGRESRVFGSDTWQMTDGLFDNPHNIWPQLDFPIIDLLDGQDVCEVCNLVKWSALDFCPQCEQERGAQKYRDLRKKAKVIPAPRKRAVA